MDDGGNMRRRMMKSKIHRATITDANLEYEGSITIDRDLMDTADLYAFEQVHVLDVNNGSRFETYVIEGTRGSGEMCVNGAAAHLVDVGDKIIVISYASYDEAELAGHEPIVVKVDDLNQATLRLGRT
jgi:aspartate 1-decarboxylase